MTTTLKRCEAIDVTLGCPCGAETVIVVAVGCVHEHLKQVAACQWHVEGLANRELRCWACWLLGHYCEMSLLREVTQ